MIDFTKPVRTKSGRSVRILCTDGPMAYFPVVGFIEGFQDAKKWTLEGFSEYLEFNNHELENVPEEVVRYIGVAGFQDVPSFLFKDIPLQIEESKQFIKCTFTDNILTHVEIVKD